MTVIVLNGFQFLQFMPGRIDHHAPQIVLLLTFVGMTIAGLRGGGRKAAIGCAAAIAVSLGISLENLPFIAVTLATLGGAWLWRGEPMTRFMRPFGIGLAAATLAVCLATIPPGTYGVVANDRFSAPHVLLCLIGGLGLATATAIEALRRTFVRRCCTTLGIGLFAAAAVLRLYPGFPASPYADVDPLVRDIWLRHVSEALPFRETLSEHPSSVVLVLVPLVSGFLAAVIAWRLSPPRTQAAWGFVVSLIAVGILGACWETRVTTSAAPLAAPLAALGGAWVVTRAVAWPGFGPLRVSSLRVLLALWPFCPVLCAMLPLPGEAAAVTRESSDTRACRDPGALKPLATLEPGLAFAPIDVGAQILAFTDLSVLGAPYHRNNVGNRFILNTLEATPAAAEAQLKANGVRYVVFCPGNKEMTELAQRNPDGFSAHLLAGEIPAGLQRLALEPTPYMVYRVQ